MTTTWYRLRHHADKIEPVEVASSTAKTVTLAATDKWGERRLHKVSSFEKFFETRAEAVKCLRDRLERERITKATRVEEIDAILEKLK